MASTTPRPVQQKISEAFACDAASEGGDSTRARQAIRELELRLSLLVTKSDAEVAHEIAEGSALVTAGWIQDGLLTSGVELGKAWSCSRQALARACDRGDLFSLKISSRRWYPAAFATLASEDVKAVSRTLDGIDASSSFVFWHRKHGSLKGMTLHEALRLGQHQAVLHAAATFAREQLGRHPTSEPRGSLTTLEQVEKTLTNLDAVLAGKSAAAT